MVKKTVENNINNNNNNTIKWNEELTRIVIKLINRRDTEPFRERVPWEELGLTDYLSVVKTPMDLGTVRNNLIKKKYNKAEECAADIRLIWHNCMSYNAPSSKFYNLARSLSEIWEKEWSQSIGKNDSYKPPSIEDLTIFAENTQRLSPSEMGNILSILGIYHIIIIIIIILLFLNHYLSIFIKKR